MKKYINGGKTMQFDVISIGAALIDMVAHVERHPGEDDEVFVSDLKLFSGGAAANTAVACAKLGLKTAFAGKIGWNDTFSKRILDDFKESKVNIEFIKYSQEVGTGSAYIALGKAGDRRIYAHSGAANLLSASDMVEKELITSKILYLSSLKNIEPFIAAATIGKKRSIPVILNPGMLIIEQGFTNIKKLLEKIDILIFSFREFKTLLQAEIQEFTESELKSQVEPLLSLGIRNVIITMGEKGACVINHAMVKLIPAFKVAKVVDTTGAGDAFSAGFIYYFCKEPNFSFDFILKCVTLGNLVASKCIQEVGARNGLPFERDLDLSEL